MDWTAERLESLSIDQLKNLRQNAEMRGNSEIVSLCAAELARRAPKRVKNSSDTSRATRKDQVVSGFHFVCDRERDVSFNPDGTFWTGTWVVRKSHAERGARDGAYIALHPTRAEPSYLQGTIKDWRRSERRKEYAEGVEAKTKYGVDFLVAPTKEPYQWVGDATGEKGYEWSELT